jgi:hypothetical protein
LAVLVVRRLVNIFVIDTDAEKPCIGPKTANSIDEISAPHLPKKRTRHHERNDEQHQNNE